MAQVPSAPWRRSSLRPPTTDHPRRRPPPPTSPPSASPAASPCGRNTPTTAAPPAVGATPAATAPTDRRPLRESPWGGRPGPGWCCGDADGIAAGERGDLVHQGGEDGLGLDPGQRRPHAGVDAVSEADVVLWVAPHEAGLGHGLVPRSPQAPPDGRTRLDRAPGGRSAVAASRRRSHASEVRRPRPASFATRQSAHSSTSRPSDFQSPIAAAFTPQE